MNSFLNRYATPLTLGLFAISAISGLFLFFHTGQGIFHEMHEWLSVVLLAPFALHVWKNWAAVVGYIRRRLLLVPLGLSLALAVAFAVPALQEGERVSPPMRAITLMTHAPLTDLAPLLKTTPDALTTELKRRGLQVDSSSDTLDAIATSSKTSAAGLLFSLVPAG